MKIVVKKRGRAVKVPVNQLCSEVYMEWLIPGWSVFVNRAKRVKANESN